MAFFWGDGFDCYASPTDLYAGYWEPGSASFILVAGRVAGSQAIGCGTSQSPLFIKTSGVNDAVHHISCAFMSGNATSTSTNTPLYLTLSDGATIQCTIGFRADGAIIITNGAFNGTTLQVYSGAWVSANVWYQYEFEVVISNTAGRFRVRRLGNPSDDFDSGAVLDTQNSANAYANKLTVGQGSAGVGGLNIDDLLWRSDASSVAWVGDVRCMTRKPVSDASVQWTPSAAVLPLNALNAPAPSNLTLAAIPKYLGFVAVCSGTIGTVALTCTGAATANFKCSLYASSGGVPTTVLASATLVTNPGVGTVTWTFSSPPSVTAGTLYFVGFCGDVSSGTFAYTNAIPSWYAVWGMPGGSYAAFPATNPGVLTGGIAFAMTVNITPTGVANAPFVADVAQDAGNSFVYSSTVGQSDLYGISSTSTPIGSVVAVTTRGLLQKSDVGTRNTSVRLKSGSSTVDSTSAALNTTWGWQWRTDTVDPATSAAWTASAVNAAQIGVILQA